MKRKVLLVDDEEMILALLRTITETLGHDAFLAHNGVEALEILRTEQVDLVVTDVAMPEMDGLALAALVKETYPGVRVVGISGKVMPPDGQESPFDAFLGKPFKFHQLEEMLTGELGRRRQPCDRHFEPW